MSNRTLLQGEERVNLLNRLHAYFEVPQLNTHKFALLGHEYPDTDSILSKWTVITFVLGRLFKDVEYKIVLASAGAIDPETTAELQADGYNVIPVDIGRSIFDQHGRGMRYGSSMELIVDYFGLWNETGIKELVRLARRADNIDPNIDETSIHYALSSLRYEYRTEAGELDPVAFLEAAFKILNGYYGRWRGLTNSRALWRKVDGVRMIKKLPNGFKIAQLGYYPQLREEAFNAGADMAIFFDRKSFQVKVEGQDMDPERAHTIGIGLHRKYRFDRYVSLHELVAALRLKEAQARETDTTSMDLTQGEIIPGCGGWFLLGTGLDEEGDEARINSGNFICCGSRKHPLTKPEEISWLYPEDIYQTAADVMSRLRWVPEKTHRQKPARRPTHANNVNKTALSQALETAKTENKKKEKIKKDTKKNKKAPAKKKAAKAKNKKKQ
jgi:hypothetical protein